MSSAEKYYKSQLKQQAVTKYVSMAKAFLFLGTFLVLFFIIREKYIDLISALGTLGYQCALCHEYPIFNYFFFSNPNTGSSVVNAYYAILINGTMSWTTSAKANGANGINNIADASNPADSDPNCTVYGYMESNHEKGYTDVIAQLQSSTCGVIEAGGDPTSFMDVINDFFTYGLPLVNTFLMIVK